MKISITHIAIILIIIAAAQYFLISTTSPIVFGDEGVYASLSRWVSENHIIPEFHPYFQNDIMMMRNTYLPMFPLIETFGFYFGEIGTKLLLPVFSLLSAFLIFILMKSHGEKKAGIIAAITLLMTPAVITYGVMGYTDTLLLMLIITSIIFITKSFDHNKKIHILLAGITIALSILTKRSGPLIIIFSILYAMKSQNKNKIKILITILIIVLIFISPWMIRNTIIFSDICLGEIRLDHSNCEALFTHESEKIAGLEFEGRNLGTGGDANLLSFGLINYFRFAHGWTIMILFILGLGYMLLNKNSLTKIASLLLISASPLIYFSMERAEDAARYLLPMNIGIVILIGLLSHELYDYFKKYNKYFGYMIIIILLFSLWVYGQEKIDTMVVVKQFSPGFIDGCNWVEENTESDSVILSAYAYHTMYQCNRKSSIGKDAEEIYLTNNDISYEHMKSNGIDYILVMNGLISQQKLREFYPADFVNYLNVDKNFENLYDNTNIYGQNGVTIYKVLQ